MILIFKTTGKWMGSRIRRSNVCYF